MLFFITMLVRPYYAAFAINAILSYLVEPRAPDSGNDDNVTALQDDILFNISSFDDVIVPEL